MRVGITFNLKSDLVPHSSFPEDIAEEYDSPETVEAIRCVLESQGHQVFLLGGQPELIDKIKQYRIDFVFNIAEGLNGRSREAHIPAVLEWLNIPYSGSDPLALALTLDKPLTKRIASSLGIRSPDFWLIHNIAEVDSFKASYPLFVKPAREGSSKGVRLSSRVENQNELKGEVNRLLKDYDSPVLIEQYIQGREFTLAVLGNDPPQVLGMMEIAYRDKAQKDFCYSLEVKRDWRRLVEYTLPDNLGAATQREMEQGALMLFRTLDLRDIARFDFRVDEEGRLYFLEVNPLPGLSPESGDVVILAGKKGLSYGKLIRNIFQAALKRYERNQIQSLV